MLVQFQPGLLDQYEGGVIVSKEQTSGGVSTLGVIPIVFIILKLVGAVDWSWGIVLIPLWISLGATVIVLLALAAMSK